MVFLRAISTNIAPKPRIFSSEAAGRGRKNPRLRGYIGGYSTKKHHISNIYTTLEGYVHDGIFKQKNQWGKI